MILHDLDRARRGKDGGLGEPLENRTRAEPVVAVAVGDEYVPERFAACFDPVDHSSSLLGRHWRIDENRVVLAGN